MFTIDQIEQAHRKVKSGADFPAYTRDLEQLGVIRYETFVKDGHADYFGSNNYHVASPAAYPDLTVSAQPIAGSFKNDLKAHQQGITDYLSFCKDCARSGIEKWVVDIPAMTCTYYDRGGNEILVENIPG